MHGMEPSTPDPPVRRGYETDNPEASIAAPMSPALMRRRRFGVSHAGWRLATYALSPVAVVAAVMAVATHCMHMKRSLRRDRG
jgi:anti-sigma-K factor RskA